MREIPVIGIHGLARSGKDTAANFILAQRGGYIYSFADPMRAMLAAIGIDMRDPYWQENKEVVIPALGVSPRRMMQTLGTEWGRELIHPEIWLTLAKQRLLNQGSGMIIPDVRFENEAAWVRSQGGVIVYITRPGGVVVEAHSSESGVAILADDVRIVNDKGLYDLQKSVREVFDGF